MIVPDIQPALIQNLIPVFHKYVNYDESSAQKESSFRFLFLTDKQARMPRGIHGIPKVPAILSTPYTRRVWAWLGGPSLT
jgi:hypothetical protein